MVEGESDLALAARHAAQARAIVARQEELIVRLAANGCSTADAKRTLQLFLDSLKIFEEHESRLRAELTTDRNLRTMLQTGRPLTPLPSRSGSNRSGHDGTTSV